MFDYIETPKEDEQEPENLTVEALRELSRKQEPGLEVLLPDDIKAGYHDVAELLHYIADMLE